MAIPDVKSLMLSVLKLLSDGQQHSRAELIERLAQEFQLSEEDRTQPLPSGGTRLSNHVDWATVFLRKAGLLQSVGRGQYQQTDRGRSVLDERPAGIDIAYLESRFPEFAEFRKTRSRRDEAGDEPPAIFNVANGTWEERAGVEERIRRRSELSMPDEAVRRAALDFVAMAIDNADEESSNAWHVRETDQGLRLMTGRRIACEIARSKMRVGVIGPITDDVRNALGADAENDSEFRIIPGGLLITFPIEHAAQALNLLRDGLNSFVDAAMARVRRAISLEDHAPEAVAYIASVVGRNLPQPIPTEPQASEELEAETDDEGGTSREPRVRGRAPIFEHGQRSIASLVSDIEDNGVIALPDLQRPFVWEDTKVRDLLDSLFLGFPVGTLVFWHTSDSKDARALGAERPGLRAATLVIDGQQRLTSLCAVMRGLEVDAKDGAKRRITIAFRPRDGRFEVADAAIRNDPEFLPDATEIWNGRRLLSQIRRDLINALRDKGRTVDDRYEDAVERNLERVRAIADYRFPTVDIRRTATTPDEEVKDEDVAEIFVRINSQGTRLGQADFVLTLLSVYHGELRDRIEDRAKDMSRGAVVGVDTQQLLRAVCGVAFERARMSAVYRYLRGVDPTTGETDTAGRLKRLNQLDDAAKECLEPTPWRDYLLRVKHAGFVSEALVGSKNAIVNAYALYIRGRRAGVPKSRLDEAISRWVFGSLLTARYSGASETRFEEDLGRVARADDAAGFVRALDDAMGETTTGDYWTVSLVSALETQRVRAPAALAFRAAQVVLGARALFSDQLIQNLLNPGVDGSRTASELHHLFPTAWLNSHGMERRIVNQVANLADVGWHENAAIGGRSSPASYVPRLRDNLAIDDDRWGRMCAEHALPPGWESMEYVRFLRERRRRMADIIRVAFRKLGGEPDSLPLTPPWFLPGAEAVWQAIVETERALRGLVREVYVGRFGEAAARRIQEALSERERETLARALRARPETAEPLSVVDYLYLGQLPALLFASDAWQDARQRLGCGPEGKSRLQTALGQIVPVRNEIAHVREVDPDRLLRAKLACAEVLQMLQGRP